MGALFAEALQFPPGLLQGLPLLSDGSLRFISGASLFPEPGLQFLLLCFQCISAGLQSQLLFTPLAMGFRESLNRLLKRRFLPFNCLLLIAESLL